jgi:hypothetical protein
MTKLWRTAAHHQPAKEKRAERVRVVRPKEGRAYWLVKTHAGERVLGATLLRAPR